MSFAPEFAQIPLRGVGLRLNERTVFLMDGLGAVASSAVMGLVLPPLSSRLGLPREILYSFAAAGAAFAVYSLSCYFLVRNLRRPLLAAIMLGNLIYCAMSAALFFKVEGLTTWGRAYLVGEILVILGVVAIEAKVFNAWQGYQPRR